MNEGMEKKNFLVKLRQTNFVWEMMLAMMRLTYSRDPAIMHG